jgi:hypothetical protein
MRKADHVKGRTSAATLEYGRLIQAKPIILRSTTKIDPTTMLAASTCTNSTSGNNVSLSRTAEPIPES